MDESKPGSAHHSYLPHIHTHIPQS